jgi:protein arginine kinase
MLHLPALVETGLIEKALKAIVQVGMNVKGFFADDEGSLGQMYQISNQFTFGFTETDFIEKLDAITHQLIHYERKARGDLLESSPVDVEDRVLRALGLLRYCKKLSVREVIEYLSSVRLGVALGIVQAPLERVTALLFLSQKAHVQYFVQDEEESADADILDHARARIVRDSLIRDDVNWEDLHV